MDSFHLQVKIIVWNGNVERWEAEINEFLAKTEDVRSIDIAQQTENNVPLVIITYEVDDPEGKVRAK